MRPRTYLLLGGLLGPAWAVLVAGLYLGGLAGQWVFLGLPTIVGVQLLLRPLGGLERRLAAAWLGVDVAPPEPLEPGGRGVLRWLRRCLLVFLDGASWRVLGWVLLRGGLGPAGLVVLPVPAWTRAMAQLHQGFAGRLLGPSPEVVARALQARVDRAEERVRLDQELHDSLGHLLSMIVVQAGAGAHLFDRDPEFARRALAMIEGRGRDALGELDRIIGASPERRPLPGADDLAALVAGAREAGIAVTARLEPGTLPPECGRAAYRIVQEALTNAAKHAPGAAVDLAVVAAGDRLAIRVVNGLTGPVGDPGRGLASIRDRAALLGGEAATGRRDGAFVVSVHLPVGDA